MGFLSQGVRWMIVGAWLAVHSAAVVAEKLGVSANTVRHWVGVWKRTGAVEEKKGKGRKPSLKGGAARKALGMLKDPAVGTAGRAAAALQATGIIKKKVSATTVARAARGVAEKKLIFHAGAPGKALNPATKAKRLAFAQANLGRDWSNVMFTDRKKFLLYSPGAPVQRGVYSEAGEQRPGVPRLNRPWALNIYAGLTMHGLTSAHVVAGSDKHKGSHTNAKGQPARNITKGQYKEVLTQTFIPEGRRLLLRGRRFAWVLQQDNDPTHHCASSVIAESSDGKAGRVSLLPNWPPHSPDLSPIENVWAIVDAKVQKMGCKTRQEWEAAVLGQLAAFPPSTISKMYKGMGKRMQQVKDAEGDRIAH
jgi:hypothetical protein